MTTKQNLIINFLMACLLLSMTNPINSLSSNNAFKPKYSGGAGVGRLLIDEMAAKEDAWQTHYDYVLCERIQGKPPTESGLYVPQEDLPKLHLCRVMALGPGKEEENGMVAPMPDIKIGDVVIAKNPWGIGPKDEETADGKKKLSYMRAQDIAAVITGGLVPDRE